MAGIRNSPGGKKTRKRAADAAVLTAMMGAFSGNGLRAVRDRAVLAIGMAAALRRSELVALTVGDVELVPEGLRLLVGRSKTDQAREGVEIAVLEGSEPRPKMDLLAWMAAARHDAGPLFGADARRRAD